MHRTTGTGAVRRLVLGSASLALAATMVACGSDDSGGDDSTAAETTASEESADPAAFCEATVDAEGAILTGPDVDFETAPPEEIQAALEEYAGTMEPMLAEMEDTAPEEVSDDVTTLTGLVRQALESGDDTAFEEPDFIAADDAIDEYMLAECGYEQLEATGVDYEYEGLPDTIEGGVVAVTFSNEGEEMHEIGVARINDDVTLPVEEVLAMPEDQVFSMITFSGAAFAAPGESDTTFMRLEPGRYGAACFVPQGTTHDAEGSGPPHFTLGMFAEFTVE